MTDQDTDNTEDSGETPLATFMKGGFSKPLTVSAGKAISRLVGATADIPVALLEGVAQKIRDETEERSIESRARATRKAKMIINDPEVVERAMNNEFSRLYRGQQNKDAVAAVAIMDLQERPSHAESTGPSDDWLNRFERYAEDASSDDLRIMFGKILAGEIRKPGAVSPATLHFVSILSSDAAKLIDRVLPYSTVEGETFLECMKESMKFDEIYELERTGFWSASKTFTFSFHKTSLSIHRIDKSFGFGIEAELGNKIVFKTGMLSRIGIDLISIIDKGFDIQAMANVALKKPNVNKFFYGNVENVENVDGGYVIYNEVEMFQSGT